MADATTLDIQAESKASGTDERISALAERIGTTDNVVSNLITEAVKLLQTGERSGTEVKLAVAGKMQEACDHAYSQFPCAKTAKVWRETLTLFRERFAEQVPSALSHGKPSEYVAIRALCEQVPGAAKLPWGSLRVVATVIDHDEDRDSYAIKDKIILLDGFLHAADYAGFVSDLVDDIADNPEDATKTRARIRDWEAEQRALGVAKLSKKHQRTVEVLALNRENGERRRKRDQLFERVAKEAATLGMGAEDIAREMIDRRIIDPPPAVADGENGPIDPATMTEEQAAALADGLIKARNFKAILTLGRCLAGVIAEATETVKASKAPGKPLDALQEVTKQATKSEVN